MKVKNWLDFDNKYKSKLRDFMSQEEEREFISDYYLCCEKEGFNKVFWTPYEEQSEHIGKKFTVLRRINEEECFLEAQPMWKIKLEDGTTFSAYPEEIVPSEMERQKCPKKYLNNKNNEDLGGNAIMEKFKLFDTITKEEGLKFKEDWENGDILAISHLLHSQSKKENSDATVTFLIALAKMNELIVEMEEEEVEWNEKFFDLYKDFIEFLADNCLEKTKEDDDINCLYARLITKLHSELFSYKEKLYRMTVDEVMNEAYKLTMFKEFVKIFETQSNKVLNAEQFNFFLRMNNVLEFLYDAWLTHDSNEGEIYANFLFKGWDWSM